MKKFIRAIGVLLLFALLLSSVAGCRTNGDGADTQNTAPQGTQPKETDAPKKDEPPKTPLDLNGYSIVIPDGATDTTVESLSAHELKAVLAELGYSVIVKEDEGAEHVDARSILLGKTAATAGNMPTGNKFTVTEKNERVQISAGNYYGYRAALDFLKGKITEAGGVPRDLNHTGTATVANTARATANSIRVMFYNLYGFESWRGNTGTTAPSAALRQDLQRDLLGAYAPDVIGFQEYFRSFEDGGQNGAADYHGSFTSSMTRLGYMQVETEVGNENCTPLFYNPLKLRVLESGSSYFTKGDANQTKGMTWAVFEVVTGDEVGKVFAVFGAHFFQNSDDLTAEQAEEARIHNATELIGAVGEVTAEYEGIAVIVGGDFNYWNVRAAGETHETLTNGGLTYMAELDGKGPAEVTNRWKADGEYSEYTESYHGFYGYDAQSKTYDVSENTLTSARYTLDYIFLGGNADAVSIKKFIIINDELTYRASDHSPTFVDLFFN